MSVRTWLAAYPASAYLQGNQPAWGPVMPATIQTREEAMTWTTPTLIEICIGLEINGYLPAEF